MHTEHRQTIHMGINYIVSPVPTIDKQSYLKFQQSIFAQGLEFAHTFIGEHEMHISRESPSRLDIRVVAGSDAPFGQILIVAPSQINGELDLFMREAEAIVEAFMMTWPSPNRQIIRSDAALRDLFATSEEHAFQELWERRLGQTADKLAVLGKPVLGGGLRFVMPEQPEDAVVVEVKIESYLRDSTKIFIDTQMVWPHPSAPGQSFELRDKLAQINDFVEDRVIPFMTGDEQ